MQVSMMDSVEGVALPLNADVFRALAVPARVELLSLLLRQGGSARVGDLAAQMAIDQSGVSRHLRELELAGVICSERRGRERIFMIRIDEMIGLFSSLVSQLQRVKRGLKCC